jgi:hypothetical protein
MLGCSGTRCRKSGWCPARGHGWTAHSPRRLNCLPRRGSRSHASAVFCVSEADAATIRTSSWWLSAVMELRRLIPGITSEIADHDTARADYDLRPHTWESGMNTEPAFFRCSD